MSMLPSVIPQPRTRHYSFGSVGGRLCDPSGSAWQPSNPNYDPGPPPPPREPKPQRQLHENANTNHHDSTTSTVGQSSGTGFTLSPSQPSTSFLGDAARQRNVRQPRGNNNSAIHLLSQLPQMPTQGNPRHSRRVRKKPTPTWRLCTREESKTSSSKPAEQRRSESNKP